MVYGRLITRFGFEADVPGNMKKGVAYERDTQ